MIVAQPLHVLAVLVWVGGMFFAHLILRPSVGALDAAVRLAQWRCVFARFFPWVWVSIARVARQRLRHGVRPLWRLRGICRSHVNIMQGLGIIMMLAFAHLLLGAVAAVPPRRRRRRLAGSGGAAGRIRGIVTFNLKSDAGARRGRRRRERALLGQTSPLALESRPRPQPQLCRRP